MKIAFFLVQRRRGFDIVSIRIFVDWRHTGGSGFFTPGGKVCLLPTSASGWVLRHWWLPQPPRRKEKWQSKNNCHRPKGCVLTKFHLVANGKEFLWTKIVLTYCEKKNCFSDQEKRLKFEAEDWEFAKFLRSLEQFILTVNGQNNFW